jgi:hypothetical protein
LHSSSSSSSSDGGSSSSGIVDVVFRGTDGTAVSVATDMSSR